MISDKAIREFKTSGKKVIAYGQAYDRDGYYLAAVADEVGLTVRVLGTPADPVRRKPGLGVRLGEVWSRCHRQNWK